MCRCCEASRTSGALEVSADATAALSSNIGSNKTARFIPASLFRRVTAGASKGTDCWPLWRSANRGLIIRTGSTSPPKRQASLGCARIDPLCHHASLLSRKLQSLAWQPRPGWPCAGSLLLCITAQAMRAVLFANATATTRLGRRRRRPITQSSALVALERSRLALAPLIRSRRKYWLPRLDMPPNRFLPPVEFWHGTKPSHAAISPPLRELARRGVGPIISVQVRLAPTPDR